MQHHDRTLRIIGGNWRGRKITFPQKDAVRPTGDRVRETLFNWLMHDIHGARCLDLFAGSGALGMEALSRGAESVVLVEQDRQVAKSIVANLEKLGAADGSWIVETTDAYQWSKTQKQAFDVIFLDPPFDDDSLSRLLIDIDTRGLARHYVYIETGKELTPDKLPTDWEITRQKRAASVHYALCRVTPD